MMNDDIMLLDAYQTIYVWIGNQSNKFEKNGAYKTANRYIQSVRDERDKESVQIVEIEAGKEPPSFTVFFPEWRIEKAQKWLEIGEQAAVAKKQEEEQKKAAQAAKAGPKGPGAGVGAGAGFKKAENLSADEVKKQEEERAKQYLDPSSNKFPYAELNGAFP